MKAAAFISLSAAFVLVAGCGASGTVPNPPSDGGGVSPYVKQGGPKPINWIQFSPGVNSQDSILIGPDKNMWFTSNGGLSQMTMTGLVSTIPFVCHGPNLALGADGNFYSGCNSSIGQISPAGVENDYPIPSGDSPSGGFALGPDGNVWFTEGQHIGKVTPSGLVAEFRYPTGVGITNSGVTAGSDGKVWFTESAAHLVASIDPAGGDRFLT